MKEYFFENRIYYRTNEFKHDRLTLVFIHGVSGSSSAWFPYENKFENKYNILNYDIRGHGNSRKYSLYKDYEIKKFVDDLHDLVVHLNITKFILISNSFAAHIHLQYANIYRDSISANIFTSPEIYQTKTLKVKVLNSLLKIFNRIISILPFNSKPRGHVDYSKHKNSTDWNIKRNFADMKNTGLRSHFYALGQSLNSKKEHNLDKINAPTLIIHGEKDSMIPIQNSIIMSQKINGSKFISIGNVDHNTVHNASKEITEIIEEFTNKLS